MSQVENVVSHQSRFNAKIYSDPNEKITQSNAKWNGARAQYVTKKILKNRFASGCVCMCVQPCQYKHIRRLIAEMKTN